MKKDADQRKDERSDRCSDERRRRLLAAAGFLGLGGASALMWLAVKLDSGPLRLHWSTERAVIGESVQLVLTRQRTVGGPRLPVRFWVRDLLSPAGLPLFLEERSVSAAPLIQVVPFCIPYPYATLEDAQLLYVAEAAGVVSPPLTMTVRRYRFSC